jgi:hypothetical protein
LEKCEKGKRGGNVNEIKKAKGKIEVKRVK